MRGRAGARLVERLPTDAEPAEAHVLFTAVLNEAATARLATLARALAVATYARGGGGAVGSLARWARRVEVSAPGPYAAGGSSKSEPA